MQQIEIYSTQRCPYCVRAKALLDTKGLAYSEIDVSANDRLMQHMITRSGQRTVPQIFIDGDPVGGFEQLSQLAASGGLD
ncbi:MAG: glutaredoxin 3 [Thiotrichales bacterium]|nr:MAG: glutaredoxin 3 [Thiotrichales bacterium]